VWALSFSIISSTPQFSAFSFPQLAAPNLAVFSVFSRTTSLQALASVQLEPSPSSPVLLVDSNTKVPGTDANFSGVSLGACARTLGPQEIARVSFVGDTPRSRGVGVFVVGVKRSQLSAEVETTVSSISEVGQEIPSRENDVRKFQFFSSPSVDGDYAAFMGFTKDRSWSGIYFKHVPSGVVSVAVDYSSTLPVLEIQENFDYFSGPVLRKNKIVFFGSHKKSESPDDSALPGLYCYDIDSKHVGAIVDWTRQVPKGSPGERFSAFSDIAFDGDSVAFVGKGTNGSLGIFVYSFNDDKLEAAVTADSAVPGHPEIKFVHFPDIPSVSGSRVLLTAENSKGGRGLYLFDIDTAKLSLIVRTGEELLGSTVAYLGSSQASVIGNQFVFYAVLANNKVVIVEGRVDSQSFQ